jgi:ubiquinone/menaquinone biosynthesis C-methylase UbiE
MRPDVISRAEHLPFADGSFDVVLTRIAPHHFADIREALGEMARVSSSLVLVVDNLYRSDVVEEAERLRDPTHVRNYGEAEWRDLFEQAGVVVECVEVLETEIDLESWLARTGCEDEEAERVRALLVDQIHDGLLAMSRIAIKGRTT